LFYPASLPKSKWFEHYAEHFDTVEINNTFYHLPKEQTLQRWHKLAPKGFLYAVKANRYITHIRRLKNTSEPLQRFFERVGLLKGKLGPILYQLPPSLHKDLDLLETFIKLLPKKPPAVFEFRHKSWYSDDTFELLGKFNTTFCIHDMPGKESPRVVTTNIIYIRFHGSTGRYSGSYSKSALRDWGKWLKAHAKKARSIYAYFNNDIGGHALNNATQLKQEFL
jgi:uncharacterized protein YecE (DUF72 family)